MPHELDHDRDKHSLFLPMLHGPFEGYQMRVTSLFVRRSVYFAFFGQALAVDVSQIRYESSSVLGLVALGSRQPNLDMQAEDFGEEQVRQTRVARLAAEERGKQENLAELTNEIQAQHEKLSSLSAQLKEYKGRLQQATQNESERRQKEVEEKVRLDRLIIEQRANLDLLAVKETEQLSQLEELTIIEQAQKHRLEHLAELLRERQERCDQLAVEERERQARLDSLAGGRRLERAPPA